MTGLWAHQRDAVTFARDRKAVLLAMAMGTGKSLVAIELMREWNVDRALIVCPKSVLQVWQNQFGKHAPREWRLEVLRTGGTVRKHKALTSAMAIGRVPMAVAINYDSVWREPLRTEFLDRVWDVVILDESHRIKAANSKVSWFCKALGRRAKRKLCLTGTPMSNSPLDLYGQFRFLAPQAYGTSFVSFRNKYAIMGGFEDRQVIAYQNQEEFKAKFAEYSFRAEASVLSLPEAMHVTRTFDLCPKAMRVYLSLQNELAAEVDSGVVTVSNALVKLLRLQQLTGGWLSDDDGNSNELDTGKASLLKDIFEEIECTEPIVVFCKFRKDLQNVRRICESEHLKQRCDPKREYFELSGKYNELSEWQRRKQCYGRFGDVLGVQIQAGGLGVDFTRARYAVYYSLGFSLGDYEQSLARIHRPGQDRPVLYLHLVASNTVDAKLYTALDRKAHVVSAVLESLNRRKVVLQ